MISQLGRLGHIILVVSLVAGICEEIGFRGYMQTPLEQKYGPVAGISITSLVFVVVHLHQTWAGGAILVQICRHLLHDRVSGLFNQFTSFLGLLPMSLLTLSTYHIGGPMLSALLNASLLA